ncbi:MAG: murein transglycosylase A [Deltaproteobacteria bacterium]|nr:murein transglycosylase A [Deltaproteobacteria bacterium]
MEKVPPFHLTEWSQVDGWDQPKQDFLYAFNVFRDSCRVLKQRSPWQTVCARAEETEPVRQEEARGFFEEHFDPHQVRNDDGTTEGLMTGYFAPDLVGDRQPSQRFRHPLYRAPEDLLTIELGELRPEFKELRLRGRVEGKKVLPYWSRAQIDGPQQPLKGQELFWVEDPVELFFLHIQGSGRIVLENGEKIMVGYADQNGHPFRSIGKLLIDSGEMSRDQMSMQNIQAWARRNPDKARRLLDENPSYIFFAELPTAFWTPPGALGLPLTPHRSLAVDRRVIPLGAPVMVSTTWPNSDYPLKNLMFAHDTGGAINGAVRGDFFWGMGNDAGRFAGRMKQKCYFWVLLPKELANPNDWR